jgi:hypothetical protein
MSAFGLTYACDDVRNAQSELETLLAQAKAARLLTTHWFSADEGHPIAVKAQTLYSQTINQNLVIFSDEACAQVSGELRASSAALRGLLAYSKVEQPSFTPPTDSPYDAPDTLDKLKPLFISVGVVAGAAILVPIIFEAVGVARMFRKGRKYRGYRGRR